ncbi:MAG: hypothetical protein JKY53_08580 [Flavobacteriales bacterium]|nr:hypothetical protein [Flavobacteriales bacterium]
MITSTGVYSQFSGDVTGDNIIDATDYIELQDIILGKENRTFISDINKDGETNVADLLILENYIYREGHAPEHSSKKQVKAQVHITPGFVDEQQNTIEIVLQNENPIAGFQLEFTGVDEITSVQGGLLEFSNMKVRIHRNRMYATLDKGKEIQAGNNVLFTLKFKGDFEEICFVKPVFVNSGAEPYSVLVGQCANDVYTKGGCEFLKAVVLENESPDKYSDVNKDGYVDISDVMIVENFLYRNGPPPPGIIEETKGKIKVSFENIDNHNKTFQVAINNKQSIAGFRLTLDGVSNVQVIGGGANDNGLKLEVQDNKLTAFLANGSPIPPGNGILLTVTYQDTTASQVCFYNPLFISLTGNQYTMQLGECKSLIPIILGCMDSLALNYNPKANKDNGLCEYPPPPPKPPKPEKQKKEKPVKEKKERAKEPVAENVEVDQEVKKQIEKSEKEKLDQKPQESGEKKQSRKEDVEKRDKKSGREKAKENAENSSDKIDLEEKVQITETDLTEIDEAVLIPKISAVERMNIPNPRKGMMVYDIDADAFIYYDGKSWRVVGSGDKQASGFDVKRKGKNWRRVNQKKE